MAYTLDDIKEAVTHLADLYADLALGDERRDYQALSEKALNALGTLEKGLNEYDKGRFHRVVNEIVEAKIRVEERKKGRKKDRIGLV